MGIYASKTKLPLNSIKASELVCKNTKNKHFVLSPKICVSIFESTGGSCSDKELQKLKDFLAKPINIKSKKSTLYDNELIRFIRRETNSKPLSSEVEMHLSNIIYHLDLNYRQPDLIRVIVLPQLELVRAENKRIQRNQWFWYWAVLFRKSFHFIYSLFRFKLTAKSLRRAPKKKLRIQTRKGLEIAHKLSLNLAVELWKHAFGHPYVKEKDKIVLKDALNMDENLYPTCRHINRVLHVKYDNEIIEALKQKESCLSSGSKARLKQVLTTMKKLENHSPLMRDFCEKSSYSLKKL